MAVANMSLRDAAKEAAGNWKRFQCFAWFRRNELNDPDAWAIFYTHNRDSGLLDLSNGEIIAKALEQFAEGNDPDLVFESHSHWAVGHISGFSIRIFRRGRITKAFRTYHELAERVENYPVLDDTDYSNREYEATVENIGNSAWKLKNDYELPDSWQDEVYSWLSEHCFTAIENCDDQGGFPSEEELIEAFEGLGYPRLEMA